MQKIIDKKKRKKKRNKKIRIFVLTETKLKNFFKIVENYSIQIISFFCKLSWVSGVQTGSKFFLGVSSSRFRFRPWSRAPALARSQPELLLRPRRRSSWRHPRHEKRLRAAKYINCQFKFVPNNKSDNFSCNLQ